MKYNIIMSGNQRSDQNASCAADAIGNALYANPGFKVMECWVGEKNGAHITFDVPKHEPISAERVQAEREEKRNNRQPRSGYGCSTDNKPAPWIQDWMNRKQV